MAYSRVTRTADGRGAVAYAEGRDGEGHNQQKVRNQVIGYVNMIPGVDAADQMQPYWNLARKNHKIQVIRVVQSFSRNELNPDNPMDIARANHVGQAFAKKYYPGRQCVVYTQIDGRSGLVHNHVLINDVEMTTHKGCTKNQYHYSAVEKWTDEVAAKYMKLDTGKAKTADKTTQTERVKREKGLYTWKDDLKKRIRDAMEAAESEEQFIESLPAFGVNVTVHNQTRGKRRGRYYTYELADFSLMPEGTKQPKNAKARSYKLGTIYDAEGVADFYAGREVFIKRNSPAADKDKETVADVPEKAESQNQAECRKEPEKKMSKQEFMDARGLEHFMFSEDGVLVGVDWEAYERNENLYRKYLEGQEESLTDTDAVAGNTGNWGQDDGCPEPKIQYDRGVDKMKRHDGAGMEKVTPAIEERETFDGKTNAGLHMKALSKEEKLKEKRRKEEQERRAELELKKKRKAAEEEEKIKKAMVIHERNRKKENENPPVSPAPCLRDLPESLDEDDIDNIDGEPIETELDAEQAKMMELKAQLLEYDRQQRREAWLKEERQRRKVAGNRMNAVKKDSRKAERHVCGRNPNGRRITSMMVADRVDNADREFGN